MTTTRLLLLSVSLAWANPEPEATLSMLPVEVSEGLAEGLAAGTQRILRARLDAWPTAYAVQATPPLPLADLQLALGCEGEGPACLSAIAESLKVRALLLPRLERVGEEVVLSMLLYDPQRSPPVARVTRRHAGPAEGLLPLAEEALRELLGVPAPEAENPAEPTPPEAPVSEPAPEPSWIGWAVGGAGVALLIGGGVAGGLAASAETRYAEASTEDSAAVDAALGHLDDARGRATAANVLYGLGGALLASGVAIYFLESSGTVRLAASPAGLQVGASW